MSMFHLTSASINSRRGFAPALARNPRAWLLLSALFTGIFPAARAVIPEAAQNDPLYAKGYLVVTHYPGVTLNGAPATAAATTTALNEALADAYAANLAAYFPEGTYVVNDLLKAYTATGTPAGQGAAFATPRRHLAMVGSTKGARPVIKLVDGAAGFADGASPRAIVDFRNYDPGRVGDPEGEAPASGYYQRLRGVDVDCGAGNPGAIGVYFNQAQGSSLEDVKVTATGAFAGFKALPGRGAAVVNLEVEGGRYGIDTGGTSNVGTVVTGAVLRNQTVSAVRHDSGFFPLVIAGFEITTSAGSTQAAVTIAGSGRSSGSMLNLIDGRILLGGEPAVAAIDNRAGRNFYARNVYVTGGTRLVKSTNANATVTGTGTWQLINEYSHCNQAAPVQADDFKISTDIIDGVVTRTPGPLANGEIIAITNDASAPPANLVSRHSWIALPSVDDSDAFDAFSAGIAPGVVSSAALQAVIDSHRKVFLRKGVYYLDGILGYNGGTPVFGPITLRGDTILFGAAKHLTRIEVDAGWNPTSETPMITTENDATATTYCGDLTLGVDATDLANDWFVALDWQAGRNSMVNIGHVYREPALTNPNPRPETNAHSLLRIRNHGGGRWYGAGARKNFTSMDPAGLFRILKAEGSTEPLWLYGLNLEGPAGVDAYAEFTGASNVRIYAVKSEFSAFPTGWEDKSVLLKYVNVTNLAQFGSSAIRNAVTGRGVIEFVGAGTDRVMATTVAPQSGAPVADSDTLRENLTGTAVGILYPHVVSLYKRGEITAADEATMSHDDVSYAPVGGNAAPAVQISAPANGASLAPGPTAITATATDADGTVSRVNFYANDSLIGFDATAPYAISWTPAAGGNYALTAMAIDDDGAATTSFTINVSVLVAPPAAPANVTALPGDGQVALIWQASSGAAGYAVKRAVASGGPYTVVASPTATGFTDVGLVNGTTYYYVVSARNSIGEGANSAEVTGTPGEPPTDMVLNSIAAEDGRVIESTATSGVGGNNFPNMSGSTAVRAGDDATNRQQLGIVSFDTSGIPANAIITSASLELRRGTGSQGNPSNLGALLVDIRTGNFGTGNELENVDFQSPATATGVATLSAPAADNDWAIGELNPAGRAAINLSGGRTQFRIRYALADNGNNTQDFMPFYSSANVVAANRPVLRVSYAVAPAITVSPVSRNVTAGGPVDFAVAATGSRPLNYEWRRNGMAITGNPTAATSALVIASASVADAGDYACVVSNAAGAATSATATLSVTPAQATVTLGDLQQTYHGTPRPVTVTTSPAGLAVVVTYDGAATAPTDAGSYAVVATVSSPDYTGGATGTLVIAPAPVGFAFSGLSQPYDGTPRAVTVTTSPAGLPVQVTYNGSPNAPVNAGTYTVVATVATPNQAGSASSVLVIERTAVTLTLAPLAQLYDGTPRVVGVTTSPVGLGVTVTYDGSTTAPVGPGSYAVAATVEDPNHTGSATGTLVVTTAVTVRHGPTFNGGLDGSVQVLLPENVVLNGGAWISGDLLVPGMPFVQLNGQPSHGGTLDGPGAATPANHRVTLNGNSVLRHLVRRTDATEMRVIAPPASPAGTRSVSLNTSSQGIGDPATLRNLTLNGTLAPVALPPGTYGTLTVNGNNTLVLGTTGAEEPELYQLQGLTLNGNSSLQLAGPVRLLLASGVTLNASAGDELNPAWLTLELASGGLTLNGAAEFHGAVVAPAGTVTINGNSTLRGRITADRLAINGNGLFEATTP